MGLRAETYGRQVSGQAEDYARQQAGAGAQYARMATDPNVTKALMNPYTRNVLDVQNEELNRQAGIATQGRNAQAVRAGAFGGGRQAIENAEAQRNLAMMKNANEAQALNQAYQQAQAQQQFGANLNLQGLAGAQQGLGTALQGGQLGLSGIGTALQGQQGALAGVGAANQAYQTGIQGSQAGIAGANTGLQGVNTQLAGVDRQLAGTAQGMQGAQVGLQGVSGAQAGYGLANQSASNLTSMLGQQQQQELGLYNTQMAMGDKKMAYDQSIKNQAVQDYANAQQYPLMQLGTMSNMLRGLPMQASTTNQYAAAPSAASQAIGTIGAGASIYNAMKPPGNAAGGEIKGYAKGGIMSYDMGGEVEDQLENMDEKGLAAQAKESSSPSIRRMAQRILRERQMGNKPQGTGPMGVQYQAAQPQMPAMRSGGIIAFQTGNQVKDPYGGPSSEEGGEEAARIDMEKRLAMPPSTTPPPGGIMGATTQPITPIPVAPVGPSPDIVKEATRQRDIYSTQANKSTADVIKEIQAERDASGIGDNKAREEYRSQQMAERVNMKDEQERQRNLRLAEFFASWGSTPGPVLVAGMNALKKSIPGIISDEKEAKKARREADKIIYDIDEATRLDKQGMHNEATARREKAASHAQDFNKQLLTFQSQRESDERALKQTTMSTEAQLEAARIQAGAQKGATAQRAKETEMYNIERSLEISRNRLAKVEQDITSTRDKPPKGTPLAKAMESVNRYNNILEKNKGDASKVDDFIKKDAEQAAAVVKRFEDDAKRRLKDARDQVNMYEQTYLTQGRGAKSGAKPSAASDDPFGIMDILKEPPASAAPANAPAKTSANASAAAPTAAPVTSSLAAKIDRETNELGAGTRKTYSPDVQEYFDKLKAERKAGEAAYLKQQQQQMLTPLR